ncbi:SDR family NAD(P)-dependent oxidoreductase [Paenibacillus sp. Y5S-9]|uniref:SDR family oxidoreductase n=1 Tax=Paenibacillus sp. Y5S-9 TaxID=3122489 RepID=UPI0030D1FD74
MHISLQGLRLLLVGGSGTLGGCLLEKMLQEGAIVAATYNQTPIHITENHTGIQDRLHVGHLDVTNTELLDESLQVLMDRLEWVDGLIYNAGIINDASFDEMSYAQWRDVMQVNLDGAFLVSQKVSQLMKARGRGKIIHVSSYRGIVGSSQQSNYAASKAGLNALTKSMARELGSFGIAVNAICPGFMRTNLNRHHAGKYQKALDESLLSRISTPEETANFILYLLSEHVANVSGQIFQMDSRG